jgi:hypothetical protein
MTAFADYLATLDGEDLACAGLKRSGADWRDDAGDPLVAPVPSGDPELVPAELVRIIRGPRTDMLRMNQRARAKAALAVIKAAQKAGVGPVRRMTIDGVTIEFGQPDAPGANDAELNEWDRDLGPNPPQIRQ